MTTKQKVARRKLSLVQLASELQNVSKACDIMGYSRQQFYEIRRDYQLYGAEGLLDRLPGPKGPHPNRVSEEVEKAILDYCLESPTHGALRVSQQLALQGVQVSSTGVRGVWSRHNLVGRSALGLIGEDRLRSLRADRSWCPSLRPSAYHPLSQAP